MVTGFVRVSPGGPPQSLRHLTLVDAVITAGDRRPTGSGAEDVYRRQPLMERTTSAAAP